MSNVSASGAGQGRLAKVIEARGGKAAAEAPFVIEHREALIYMLCEAAELEHGIMCQYLFAAFSLKQREDEGLTADELTAVTRWRRSIAHVATEEMLHLALVHNLLSALGAAPHLARPNLPAPAHHYPAGVNLTLVPFGESALRHFMFLERPEGMALRDAEGLAAAAQEAVPLMTEHDLVPRSQDFATVGHLYRSIEVGLAHLAEKYGEQGLFVGPPGVQATTTNFSWPELVAVTDLASAQQAIDTILEQGEGARGDWQDAHFGQFVRVLDEYRQMREANAGFDPVRPVLVANVRPCEHAEVPLIGDQVTARCSDLFNVAYEVLLQALERYFAHTEETDAQLATLADATLGLMLRVLKPLGDLITTLPVGPDHPGMTAGPSFELFYESDYLMPHREAAWMLLEERLREAVKFCTRLQGEAGEPLSGQLAPVGQALSETADSLAAHFADWGATSRFSTDQATPDAPAQDPDGIARLLSQSAELARAVANVSITDDVGRQVHRLFAAAQQLIGATTGESSSASAEPGQESKIAMRLVTSVLRPLASGLANGHPDDAAPEAPPDTSANVPESLPRLNSSVEDEIWTLAQTATRLRASVASDHPLTDSVLEATACLQDLAVELAPAEGPDGAATRLAHLRELQKELAGEIRAAANGPYLVTEAENLRNWLGEPMPARPQMALCRCGASAIKPYCDGTHARIDFTDAKDPHRVADRRDGYVGQQVTILDNRGTCQHSGLCTDRLATAFRLGEEPFVQPSGGRMDELIRAVRDCPSGALSYALDGVEARAEVDFHDQREPMIEATKDGPYRVTGSIALRGPGAGAVPRNQGASLEHYALCRCGHSQNKPFCSGMHWYVDFHDPLPDPQRTPTMFEWAGGLPALTRMTRLFYERYVPQDPLLAPLFANMSADHPQRVAMWLGEVFGGPPCYSEQYGGYPRMLSQHIGKRITEDWRARWVALLLQSAREAGLPNDAEFRSAFQAYIEWGSRLAVENSQATAKPPEHMPMPRWDWSTGAGAPDSRISATAPAEDEPAVVLPADDEPVRFEKHIKPLFRQRDRQSMKFAFDLWSYDEVKTNADAILERVRAGTMPCDGAWPTDKVDAFQRWVSSGTRP